MSFEQSIKFHTLDTREEEKHNQKPNIHRHTHTSPSKPAAAIRWQELAVGRPRPNRARVVHPKPRLPSPSLSHVCALFHPPRTHTLKRRPVRRKLENALISSLPPVPLHPTTRFPPEKLIHIFLAGPLSVFPAGRRRWFALSS